MIGCGCLTFGIAGGRHLPSGQIVRVFRTGYGTLTTLLYC